MNVKKRKISDAFTTHRGHNSTTARPNILPPGHDTKVVHFPATDGDASTDFITSTHTSRGRTASLRAQAAALPIAAHKSTILFALSSHDVLLLIGETGSGKSTQVPQFLLPELSRILDDDDGGGGCGGCRSTSEIPNGRHRVQPPHHPNNRRGPTTTKQQQGYRSKCIAITQPRRVAAISLARRVAEEMDVSLGREVGYSVRFDAKFGRDTQIKYVTEGMLFREMMEDRDLSRYGVVVVDEVHERSVGVDLVLGLLKGVMSRRRRRRGVRQGDKDGNLSRLKVVVMSATAEMEGLKRFFEDEEEERMEEENGVSGIGDHGNPAGDQGQHEDECDEWEGFSDTACPGSPRHFVNGAAANGTHCSTSKPSVTCLHIPGRQFPVTINYAPSAVPDVLSACLDRITSIHTTTPLPGDVLVFLKGQDQVEQLESLCQSYAASLNRPPPTTTTSTSTTASNSVIQTGGGAHHHHHHHPADPKLPALQILPLFAALPTHQQSLIFHPAPPYTRKIILATNIAETSLTIPGITHVIDTGYRKIRAFRPLLHLETLLTVPISKSSARQRAGRAGRTGPGTCWRLYTRHTYERDLEEGDEPEVLRSDLMGVVLTLKALGVRDVLASSSSSSSSSNNSSRSNGSTNTTAAGHRAEEEEEEEEDEEEAAFSWVLPPKRASVEMALGGLLQLGALDDGGVDGGGGQEHHRSAAGTITQVGEKMARMPLTPRLARVLLRSTEMGIVEQMCDLLAALSVENFWIGGGAVINDTNNNNKTVSGGDDDDDSAVSRVVENRRTLLGAREGDHIMLLKAVRGYMALQNSTKREWCQGVGISVRAMSAVKDVRKQLRALMGLSTSSNESLVSTTTINTAVAAGDIGKSIEVSADEASTVLKCLLFGFLDNVARLTGDTNDRKRASSGGVAHYSTFETNQQIVIHPSSSMFGRKVEGIVYTEFVFTTKAYARNVSAIEMGWVEEVLRQRMSQ